MEDEDKIFYDSEMDIFGDNTPIYHSLNRFDPLPLFSQHSSGSKEDYPSSEIKPEIKAFNPMEHLKSLPESRHPEFLNYFNNHKTLNGIQHFFRFGEEDQHREEFLQNIESDAMGDNNGSSFELDKLFKGQDKASHLENIQSTLETLHKKIQEIHHKTLSSMNLGKTISNAFQEHFQNFTLVLNSSTFFEYFQDNFKSMANHCKKIKGPSIELILSLYEFWSKSFKDLITQIWRYSSKFTLNFFKKSEPQEVDSSSNAISSDIRSESSNTINSKDKRKGWTKEETECLLKYLDSNIIFTQSVLKTLASQFNRSVSSVSSKIQKLIKSKKGEESQEDSLLRKSIEILKMYEEGLTRDSIIQKLNEHYEMGYGGQWEKSVGQLLSSKKEFLRIRGKHKLSNPHQFKISSKEDENNKLTFKDKVVQVFLTLPNCEGDLKTVVDKYIALYGEGQPDGEIVNQDRRKTIEGNISKTLSRYDIFDNSRAKTKYVLNPLFKPVQTNDMDVQNFFAL